MSNSISVQKEFVEVRGGKLATIIKTPLKPIADVVLVHGFTGSKEDFTDLSQLLAELDFRVLTFDNRGQHESSHSANPDDYSMTSLARDVIELSKNLGFRNPHLFGHSLGGLISQEVAFLEPNMWSSLTLFCSGPEGKNDWFDEPQFKNLTNETKSDIWREIIAPQNLDNPKKDLKEKRWLASDAISTMASHGHLRNFKSKISEIAKSEIPAHVVYGELDDVWPLNEQDKMARELNAKLTVLLGCGHCPNEENPELTAQTLANFWSKTT